MARKKPSAKHLTDLAAATAEYAAKALIAAEQLRVKTKAVERFPLNGHERATRAQLLAMPAKVKKKLAKKGSSFTVAETAGIVMAVADSFPDAEPKQLASLLDIAKKLMDGLHALLSKGAIS